MNLSERKIVSIAERVLKRTVEYQKNKELDSENNYEIIYLLAKDNRLNPRDVMAFAGWEENVISFHPFISDEKPICNWNFNFEHDLFELLESGHELAHMSLECHYNVWRA